MKHDTRPWNQYAATNFVMCCGHPSKVRADHSRYDHDRVSTAHQKIELTRETVYVPYILTATTVIIEYVSYCLYYLYVYIYRMLHVFISAHKYTMQTFRFSFITISLKNPCYNCFHKQTSVRYIFFSYLLHHPAICLQFAFVS